MKKNEDDSFKQQEDMETIQVIKISSKTLIFENGVAGFSGCSRFPRTDVGGQ